MPRPDKMKAARLRFVMLRACAVLFGLALAGLAAESGLRLAGIDQSYLTPLGSFFEPDPHLGFRGRPDFSGRFRQTDFDVHVVHNALGFRKHEREPDHEPPARSVYVLGDSFTWGYGVAQGGVFTDLLQERLPDTRVWNFGLCASGTVQQYAIFEQHVRPHLQPDDVVVLSFYANDFSDNAGHCIAFPRLYAELCGGGVREVLPRQLRLATLKKRLKDSSCLVSFLACCWDRLRESRAPSEPPAAGGSGMDSASTASIRSSAAADSESVISATLCDRPEMKITEHYLLAFRDACRLSGARFLVVYIPDPSEYGEHVGARVAELSAERRALLSRANQLRIATLDLLPVITQEKVRDDTLRLTFPSDFHWNPRGHELIAAVLCRAIDDGAALADN
ncbi:MAG TPA: GDSL-type esterase/lipase family protein [Planctomycetaceae bacterium]|nr:GDSL-type esterase/lipase family protein [Planctomycetaceae bacterium]